MKPNKSGNIMRKMNKYYKGFCSIFSCDFEENLTDLIEQLKTRFNNDNTLCRKIIKSKAWRCNDCFLSSDTLYCEDCYFKQDHQGHSVKMITDSKGYCDCGDGNAMQTSAFCSLHRGKYTEVFQIKSYINKIFRPQEKKLILMYLNYLYTTITPLINNDNNNENDDQAKEILNYFLNFLIKICTASEVFIYILTKFLIKECEHPTTHQCFSITLESIEMMPENEIGNVHQCKCSKMRMFINAYRDNDKLQELFMLFRYDFRGETVMYLSLISLYDIFLITPNNSTCKFIAYLTQDPVYIFVRETDLIAHYTQMILEIIKNCIDKKEGFKKVIQSLTTWNYLITLILKVDRLKNWKKTMILYQSYIDFLCLFHNCMTNEEIVKVTDEDIDDLVMIEKIMLRQMSLMTSLYIFTIEGTKIYNEITETLLGIFFTKINDLTSYRQLSHNEYSFHIPLYRAFSILLIKHVFHEVLINHCNLINVIETLPSFEEYDFTRIILEVLKSFGFILACKQEHWVDIVRDLTIVYESYQHYYTFHNCDFSLITILCLLKKYSHLLSISSIIKATDICDCYDYFLHYEDLEVKEQDVYLENINQPEQKIYCHDLLCYRVDFFDDYYYVTKVFFKSISTIALRMKLPLSTEINNLFTEAITTLQLDQQTNFCFIKEKEAPSDISKTMVNLLDELVTDQKLIEYSIHEVKELLLLSKNNSKSYFAKRKIVLTIMEKITRPWMEIENIIKTNNKESSSALFNNK